MDGFRTAAAAAVLAAMSFTAAAGDARPIAKSAQPRTISLMAYSLALIDAEQKQVARQDAKVALGQLRAQVQPKVAANVPAGKSPTVKSGS